MSSSPRKAAPVVVVFSLLLGGSALAAGPTITLTADGKCTVTPGPSHDKTVKLHVKLATDASAVSLLNEKATGSAPRSFEATIKRSDLQSDPVGKFKVDVTPLGSTTPVSYECDTTDHLFFFPENTNAPPPPAAGAKMSEADDKAAQDWWAGANGAGGPAEIERMRNLGRELGLPACTAFIVHKPSGKTIFPTATAITEGTPVQVAILLPKNDQRSLPGIEFEDCDAPDPQRVVPSEPAGGKQGLHVELTGPQAQGFELRPLGAWRRCGAGKLTYHLTMDRQGKTKIDTVLRVRPKYHFAGIALLGYDWAKRRGFEKLSDPTGMTTTIGQVDSRVGAIAYVGAQWMIGGVDYEAMRWYNHIANLFLAVNVASPLNDAVVGLALTPTGGTSLAVGASFHSGKRLTNGATVGQPFMGNGDLPTADTWDGVKPGVFVGLAIDSRVADALSTRFKGGTADDTAKDSGGSGTDDSKSDGSKSDGSKSDDSGK